MGVTIGNVRCLKWGVGVLILGHGVDVIVAIVLLCEYLISTSVLLMIISMIVLF